MLRVVRVLGTFSLIKWLHYQLSEKLSRKGFLFKCIFFYLCKVCLALLGKKSFRIFNSTFVVLVKGISKEAVYSSAVNLLCCCFLGHRKLSLQWLSE